MITEAARSTLATELGDAIRFDVALSRFTSLRVGGPADAVAAPETREALSRLLALCRRLEIPHTLLGAGFNTLVRDGGLDGVAIHLRRFRGLDVRPNGVLRAEAGVSHSQVNRLCAQVGLHGLEFAAGIPGTVGGWIAMNAGIGVREMKDVVLEIEVVSPCGRQQRRFDRAELRFHYRALRGLAPGSVILTAWFAVQPAPPESIKVEVSRLLAARADTQPINVPSCGSVFRNPKGDHAGRLIEAAGLKGTRIGGAEISPVHANFIANVGGATASDVIGLIELAQKEVCLQTGVQLQTEVKIVGRTA